MTVFYPKMRRIFYFYLEGDQVLFNDESPMDLKKVIYARQTCVLTFLLLY